MEENINTIKKTGLNKTWILVAGLVILTAILLIVSLTSKNFPPLSSSPKNAKTDFAHTSLAISEDIRSSSVSGKYEADVTIDTDKDKVNGVQIELSYNPKTLTNVDIKPGSFFTDPTVLIKTIDTKNGVIRYALAIKPNEEMLKGMGTVATISFSKVGISETTLNFLPQSQVSTRGLNQSVLKKTISGLISDPPASPKTTQGSN